MRRFWLRSAIAAGLVLLPHQAVAQTATATASTVAGAPQTTEAPQAPTADPANGASARQLFERGVELSEQKLWLEAERAFARSAELAPSTACYLNLAVTRFELGLPVEGLSALDALDASGLSASPEQAERKRGIRERLEQTVATLQLEVKPRGATLSLDGKELATSVNAASVRLNPGKHVLAARAPGYLDASTNVEVAAGERRTLELMLAPTPEAAAKARPLVAPGPRLQTPVKLTKREAPTAPKRSLFSKPWFWVGTGALVVAGVVATAIAASSNPAPTYGSEGRAF